MNTKDTKKLILSLTILTIIQGALPSLSSANVITSLSSLEPERLGDGFVSTIALSPDGTVIAAAHKTSTAGFRTQTHTVFLWDTRTHEQIGELPIGNIRSMAFSPDGTLLALGSGSGNGTIHLWNVAGQSQMGEIDPPGQNAIPSIAFSPDGVLLASTSNGNQSAHIWEVPSLRDIGALPIGVIGQSVTFSPDGTLLLTGGNRADLRIKLWDVDTQTQVGALTGHLDATYDLAFNPDGSILASAGGAYDQAVYLWDFNAKSQVGVLGGHPGHVYSVAFSPDGNILASTSFLADVVYIWDVQTQTQLGQLRNHDLSSLPGWNHEAIFDPGGEWLACSSGNGVEIWDLTALLTVDFNSDGAVDVDDLIRLIESWGLDDPMVDIGPMPWGDGIVDAQDVLVLAEHMVEYDSHTDELQ